MVGREARQGYVFSAPLSIGQGLKAKIQRQTTFRNGNRPRIHHTGLWPVRLRILKKGRRMLRKQSRPRE